MKCMQYVNLHQLFLFEHLWLSTPFSNTTRLSKNMNIAKEIFLAFLLVILLIIPVVSGAHFNSEKNGVKCLRRERQAVLQFKDGLIDNYGQLSSWENEEDCCLWEGVLCDNQTLHVVGLDLSELAPLRGQVISPSLLELVDLNYLDLSFVDFNGIIFPDFIGSLGKLQSLKLSSCNFAGLIPPSLGNLSMLSFLELSDNWGLTTHSRLHWLSSLRSLEFLDLSFIYFESSGALMEAITKLPNLKEVYLNNCGLFFAQRITFTLNYSTSLAVLDLSDNSLDFTSDFRRSAVLIFTHLLQSCTSLSYVDLSSNLGDWSILDALKDLRSLSHLGLNSFGLEGSIPYAFENFTYLSHLGLSSNHLEGNILETLGNLTHLSFLDVSNNGMEGKIPNIFTNLKSLSHLDLSYNKLHVSANVSVSSLTYLDLSHNEFQEDLANLMVQFWESTMLEYIDMSKNVLFGSVPNMSRFRYLKELKLNGNHLNESIGEDFLRLPYLEVLDVSRNKLIGRVPNLLPCLSLRELILNDNMFNGTLTDGVGNLFKLEYLNLDSNHLEGLISEAHFLNLSNLHFLSLSFNSNLTVRFNSRWNPPFQLLTLGLANCNLGSHFPEWIQNQRYVAYLDISNAQINDIVPDWFWKNMQLCSYLNMSNNQIHGVLPDNSLSVLVSLLSLDLSFNQFHGSIPPVPPKAGDINLSRNRFSCTIINFCNPSELRVLDLSDNLLSGQISPECFSNFMGLLYLNLANNSLSGEVLTYYYTNCDLISLYLNNNNFSGSIPSVDNCVHLIALDLGVNQFRGDIPEWLGVTMPDLVVLSLKSNQFSGSLPSSLCELSKIQVVDISMNRISGTIPNCVGNFPMLNSKSDFSSTGLQLWARSVNWTSFRNRASVTWKGRLAEYVNTLWLLKIIDLSSNNLEGEIPREVTSLQGLIGLNLSRNNLVGSISPYISKMDLLDFLDLSHNKLSGSIPSTLSQLSHLGVLDLSFNNLSGKIPYINHIDTFSASSYIGNPELCGPPLVSKPCPEDDGNEMPKKRKKARHGHMFESGDLYVSLVLGFSVGFWAAFWTLFFSKKLKAVTNKMFLSVGDWLYVKILVNKRHLQRCFGNCSE